METLPGTKLIFKNVDKEFKYKKPKEIDISIDEKSRNKIIHRLNKLRPLKTQLELKLAKMHGFGGLAINAEKIFIVVIDNQTKQNVKKLLTKKELKQSKIIVADYKPINGAKPKVRQALKQNK